MELRHLRYFVAAAEERHFGRAARAAHPVPDRADKCRRRAPGKLRWILARAEQAIRNVERAGRGEFGKLCVGFTFAASFDAFVPATIRTFQQTYPGVSLTLRKADSLAFCRGLLEGEVDAPFIRPLASHDERIQFDGLFDEDMLVALPAGHPRLVERALHPLSPKTRADDP